MQAYHRWLLTVGSAAAVAVAAGASVGPAPAGAAEVPAQYSSVVHVLSDGRGCSGVLVDPEWILTAASCVAAKDQQGEGAPAAATTVTVGRNGVADMGRSYPVTRVVVRSDRDVALVQLPSPVEGVQPAKLATAAPQPGAVLTLAGYGRTATEWVTDRVLVSRAAVATVTATTLNVDALDGKAPCKGDAGGPAFDASSELTALHTSSWQAGCLDVTETRTEAVETRVDDLAPWVAGYTGRCRTAAPAGFTAIWDGRSPQSSSWRTAGGAVLSAKDCELTVGPDNNAGAWYGAENLPAAYTLRAQWKAASAKSDAGIFLGFTDPTDRPRETFDRGVEVQIAPDEIGGLVALQRPTVQNAARPVGEWNTFEITVTGRTIVVFLNGVEVNRHTLSDPNRFASSAYVGLQGSPAQTAVTFRNVQLRVNRAPATFGPLTNAFNGGCADVEGSRVDDGTRLSVRDCRERQDNQQFTALPDGSLQVMGRCLDAGGTVVSGGDRFAQLYECNQTDAQVWQRQANGTLYSPRAERCLDYPPGQYLYSHRCHAGTNQQWQLPTAKARFGLVRGLGGRCLDAEDYNRNFGTAIHLVPCRENQSNQMFTLTADGSIRVLGRCLDDNGPLRGDGQHNVQLYECNGTPAQTFVHRPDNTLYSARLNKCLDAPFDQAKPRLYFFDCHGQAHQQFAVPALGSGVTGAATLEPVPVPPPTPPVADR